MAHRYGPKIVRDGLVFAVDAGNAKSVVTTDTRAASLDKTKQQFLNSSSTDFDFSINNDYSFSFWWKNDGNGSDTVLASNKATTGAKKRIFSFWRRNSVNDLFALFHDAASGQVYNRWNPQPSLGTWYHYVLTYDGSDRTGAGVKLYIDGVLETVVNNSDISVPLAGESGTVGQFQIGHEGVEASYAAASFDNYAVYNKALTSGETAALYNSGAGLSYGSAMTHGTEDLSTDLVSWYSFNETQGTRYDQTGTNDLTDNNGVGTTTGLVQETETFLSVYDLMDQTSGRGPNRQPNGNPINGVELIDGAWNFDGVNDYMNFGSFLNSSLSNIVNDASFECWLKPNELSTTAFETILETNNDSTKGLFQVLYDNRIAASLVNSLRCRVGSGTAGYTFESNNYFTGYFHKWVHITFTLTGSTMNFYRNGIFINSEASAPALATPRNYSSAGPEDVILIGGRDTNSGTATVTINHFDGPISKMSIYNKALSSAEVLQNYNETKSRFL